MAARFLSLDDVADELAVSRAQAYSLVRTGTLPAIKLGGRGQWRVERRREEWIDTQHRITAQWIKEHPWTAGREDRDGPEQDPKAEPASEPEPPTDEHQ